MILHLALCLRRGWWGDSREQPHRKMGQTCVVELEISMRAGQSRRRRASAPRGTLPLGKEERDRNGTYASGVERFRERGIFLAATQKLHGGEEKKKKEPLDFLCTLLAGHFFPSQIFLAS